MTIAFSQIPSALRVPGSYNEIDNSLAGASTGLKNVLLLGYKSTSGATAPSDSVSAISSANQAKALFGEGSMLYHMAKAFMEQNPFTNLFALPVAEPSSGTAASLTLTVTGTATSAGELTFQLNGKTITASVADTDTADKVGKSVEAAINSKVSLGLEATSTAGAVKLNYLHKGELGVPIIITHIQSTATGITASAGSLTDGTGTPDLSASLAHLDVPHYHYFINPFDDTTNMKTLSDELERRYSAMVQLGARAFMAKSGTVGELKAWSGAQNSPHISALGIDIPTQASFCVASVYAAHTISQLSNDPSQPLNGLKLTGLDTPSTSFAFESRNSLLFKGISTFTTAVDGSVYLERPITLYTLDADGNADSSYLDIQVPETLDAMRGERNALIQKRFKGYKLSKDGATFAPGTKVMTPIAFKAFLLDLYKRVFMEERAFVEDYDHYKESLIVEVGASDKSRLDFQEEPTLIGRFYVAAGLTSFK